jgi:hypothetical protein
MKMAENATVTKVDLEVLKERQPTQDELDAIGLEALNEGDAKTKSDEDKEIERIAKEQAEAADKSDKETKDTKKESKKEENDDDGKTLTADEIKAEQERILKAKDEDLKPEEKEQKAELIKLRGDDAVKKTQADAEAYAVKHNISVEDAKKEFESIGKIEEKYGKDPKQLAQAYLHLQKSLAKKDEEIKSVQESVRRASMPTVDYYLQLVDSGKVINPKTKQPTTRDELVAAYREHEPEITDNMDDDAVARLASKSIVNKFQETVEKQGIEISSKAKEKRVTLLNSIPEADRKYVAEEIKPLLDKYPDNQIMSDAFSIQDVLYWVKGKHIDDIIKETDEKAYNRGLSEAKILARKSDNPKGNQGNGGPGKKSSLLTDAQKSEAEDMYTSALDAGTSKDTVYEWYAELNLIGGKK